MLVSLAMTSLPFFFGGINRYDLFFLVRLGWGAVLGGWDGGWWRSREIAISLSGGDFWGRFTCDGKWANAIWLSRLLTRIRKKIHVRDEQRPFLPLKSPSRGRLELWKGPFGAWLSLLPSGFMKNPRERRAKTNYTIKNPSERWAWTAKESWTPICPWGNSDKVKIDQKLQFQRLFSMFGAFNGFVDLPLIPWSTFGCILLDFLAQMSPKSQFCVRWSSIRSLARQSRSFCSLMCISEPKWPIKKTIAVWTRPKLLKCTVYWALQWILAPFSEQDKKYQLKVWAIMHLGSFYGLWRPQNWPLGDFFFNRLTLGAFLALLCP